MTIEFDMFSFVLGLIAFPVIVWLYVGIVETVQRRQIWNNITYDSLTQGRERREWIRTYQETHPETTEHEESELVKVIYPQP